MSDAILLAVDESTTSLTADDRFLRDALERRGVPVLPHLWGEPVRAGATIVIRSTRSYIEDSARFNDWLDHLDRQHAVVHNNTGLLRWNMHKAAQRIVYTSAKRLAPRRGACSCPSRQWPSMRVSTSSSTAAHFSYWSSS
jgi:hypothetical protein